MEKDNINKVMLAQYTRRLLAASGKFNLYINMCCENSNPNMERIASELRSIKHLVANIETECNNIWAK